MVKALPAVSRWGWPGTKRGFLFSTVHLRLGPQRKGGRSPEVKRQTRLEESAGRSPGKLQTASVAAQDRQIRLEAILGLTAGRYNCHPSRSSRLPLPRTRLIVFLFFGSQCRRRCRSGRLTRRDAAFWIVVSAPDRRLPDKQFLNWTVRIELSRVICSKSFSAGKSGGGRGQLLYAQAGGLCHFGWRPVPCLNDSSTFCCHLMPSAGHLHLGGRVRGRRAITGLGEERSITGRRRCGQEGKAEEHAEA